MILMGIDIGQKRDPTAICVAETDKRYDGRRRGLHYIVRHLERMSSPCPVWSAKA